MERTFSGVLFEAVHQFEGRYPEVPLAPGVDYGALIAGDSDPVFLTLPVGQINAESRNKRVYEKEHVQAIHDAIMERRPGGISGHLRDEERPYANPPKVLRWVGAIWVGETLWGKAYVLPHAQHIREEIRTAKASNAAVGTSIYGRATIGENGNMSDLFVETIDYVDPTRVGIPMTEHVPLVTSESDKEEDVDTETDKTLDTPEPEVPEGELPDETTEETNTMPDGMILITEAQANQDKALNEARAADRAKIAELNQNNTKISNALVDWTAVQELLSNPEYPVVALQALLAETEQLKRENAQLLEGYIKAQVAEKVVIEAVRPMIVSLVETEKPAKRGDVDATLTKVLDRKEVKDLLKAQTASEMGPNQTPANTNPSDDTTDDTPLGETAVSDLSIIWS